MRVSFCIVAASKRVSRAPPAIRTFATGDEGRRVVQSLAQRKVVAEMAMELSRKHGSNHLGMGMGRTRDRNCIGNFRIESELESSRTANMLS